MTLDTSHHMQLRTQDVLTFLVWKWGTFFSQLVLVPFAVPQALGSPHLPWVLGGWLLHALFYSSAILRAGPGRISCLHLHLSVALDVVLTSFLILVSSEMHNPMYLALPAHVLAVATLRPYWADALLATTTAMTGYVGAHTVHAGSAHFMTEPEHWAQMVLTVFVAVAAFFSIRRLLERYECAVREKVELERSAQCLADDNEKFQELSFTDPLTGLLNHRYFYQVLPEVMDRAQRNSFPMALIMLDIDFFKQYNDTHGHVAGDQVLRTLAGLMVRACRQGDIVCRYGGEEFSIILPRTTMDEALVVAERVREAISQHPFPGHETQPGGQITVSMGVVAYPGDAGAPGELVDRADQALYAAKGSGRNTSVAHAAMHTPGLDGPWLPGECDPSDPASPPASWDADPQP